MSGYSEEFIYGWEDFDFWLSLIERGARVWRIPETLFYYRVRTSGMASRMSREHYVYSFQKLFQRHEELYAENIGALLYRVLAGSPLGEHESLTEEAQVYVSRHGQFLEERSLHARYRRGVWATLAFPLAPQEALAGQPLRFDPAQRSGMAEIASIGLRNRETDEVVWECSGPALLANSEVGGTALIVPSDESLTIVSVGDDPIVVFRHPQELHFAGDLILEVRMRFTTDQLGLIAVRGQLHQQQEELQAAQGEVHALERQVVTGREQVDALSRSLVQERAAMSSVLSSRSWRFTAPARAAAERAGSLLDYVRRIRFRRRSPGAD